jgi:hypothetical protein
MKLLDPRGEEIPFGDERACCACGVYDHKDAGADCDHCNGWAHSECMESGCSLHRLCEPCAEAAPPDKHGDPTCPACEQGRALDDAGSGRAINFQSRNP